MGNKPSPPGDVPRELALAGRLCLAFANTAASQLDHRSPTLVASSPPILGSYRDLVEWRRRMGALEHGDAERLTRAASEQPGETAEVFQQAIRLRDSLMRIFPALAMGKPAAAEDLDVLNGAVKTALAARHIVPDRGFRWAWDDEQPLDEMLRPPSQPVGVWQRRQESPTPGASLLASARHSRGASFYVPPKTSNDVEAQCEEERPSHLFHLSRLQPRDQGADLPPRHRLHVIEVDGTVPGHAVLGRQHKLGGDLTNRRGHGGDRDLAEEFRRGVASEQQDGPFLVGSGESIPADVASQHQSTQTCSSSQSPTSSGRTGCRR